MTNKENNGQSAVPKKFKHTQKIHKLAQAWLIIQQLNNKISFKGRKNKRNTKNTENTETEKKSFQKNFKHLLNFLNQRTPHSFKIIKIHHLL